MVTSSNRRFIPFETCFNFRDLGGYTGLHNRKVRWGRVYRSMAPIYMTEADVERARELNIRLVIDLRGASFETSGPIGEPPARRIPVGPNFRRMMEEASPEIQAFLTAPPEDALPRLLTSYAPSFAEAITAMAADLDANMMFHCRLGKDRTGVFAALLLKLLRVSDGDVVEDYMLTAQAEEQMKRLLDSHDDTLGARAPRVAREPVEHGAIESVLERLESQYGTAYNYFLRQGVLPADLNALIENLLEPAAHSFSSQRSGLPVGTLSQN
jgi:hypothetical protein